MSREREREICCKWCVQPIYIYIYISVSVPCPNLCRSLWEREMDAEATRAQLMNRQIKFFSPITGCKVSGEETGSKDLFCRESSASSSLPRLVFAANRRFDTKYTSLSLSHSFLGEAKRKSRGLQKSFSGDKRRSNAIRITPEFRYRPGMSTWKFYERIKWRDASSPRWPGHVDIYFI